MLRCNAMYLHAQLCDSNASILALRSVPILPDGFTELRARDEDFVDRHTCPGLDRLDNGVYSCV